ncbi:MAPK regulated corepressor interacting protein 2 isoform X2 [Fundulus heteroclitus]|uniref:MAPK regulated corepressor interacting protein 2 isoform X2 n=1 Tax=Fundulus heteroclitus TaxID=8078 RepID=UPI00165B6116|nr:MAPK regulated corepressor interacting protein 2 isoform X2 [Fundulus heteroclitus]
MWVNALKKPEATSELLFVFPINKQTMHDGCSPSSPPPKIVFNRLNGKRHNGTATQKSHSPAAEGFTPAHEENVRFVYEVWQEVEQKLEDRGESADSKGPVQYTEKTPSTVMKNFVPIDLEEWWAQRFLANIANLS